MRSILTAGRAAIHGVAIAIIAGSMLILSWFAIAGESAERLIAGEQPIQFFVPLEVDLLDDYSAVFGIAHNSGDSVAVAREALEHGADVIEIDVVAIGGRLHAAHDVPPRYVDRYVSRAPTLDAVWQVARGADAVALDLKESSPRYLDLVIAFLNEHPDHQLIVSSREPTALRRIEERAPHAFRFLSIGTHAHFEALRRDPGLVTYLDGVGIRETLIDADVAGWLQASGLMIHAWTVNDGARMNELVELGVDAITTDNLAIMQLLGGLRRGEEQLLHRGESRSTAN
jgi:glycerophosphoryl diester phosphodiesterase